MYDQLAPGYEELYGEEQRTKVQLILPYLKGKILDVGAGTGILAKTVSNVTSIDPSKEMLSLAPEPKQVASAEDIPYLNGDFETIVCLSVIHHCDLEKVIEEFKRLNPKVLIISILKRAKEFKCIVHNLKENFDMVEIDEKKDLILIKK
jgi:2-polyprenyl-3-methyl-5-hydroxy-6-metoxy-1,4-benzoquinol methylase